MSERSHARLPQLMIFVSMCLVDDNVVVLCRLHTRCEAVTTASADAIAIAAAVVVVVSTWSQAIRIKLNETWL